MTTIAIPAKKLSKPQQLIMNWLDNCIENGINELYVEIGRYKSIQSMVTITSLVKRGLIVIKSKGEMSVRVSKAVEPQPEPAPAAAPEVAETVATPAPDFAEHWTVDEVAECLPGMTSFGAYDALWSFVPADDQEAPTLADVWDKLEESHRIAIIEGYAKEYPQVSQSAGSVDVFPILTTDAPAVKRTYRHMVESGRIFACCPTTQAYTHVVVASENRDHDKAEVLTAKWEKFWRENYQNSQQQISHPYDKHGRPLATAVYNSAVTILNQFPTEQGYVDHQRQRELARLDANVYTPTVMEWLTSLEDAQKTAQAFAQKPCLTGIKIEAINGGTR